MEGRRHRQFLAADLFAAEDFACFADLRRGAGEDTLLRRVAIGQYQIQTFFVQQLFNLGEGGGDRQHRAAVAVAGRHQFAAQARQGVQGRPVEAAGGAQGGQFAVAVAGTGVGANAEGGKNIESAEADGAEGRLGDFGRLQAAFVRPAARRR